MGALAQLLTLSVMRIGPFVQICHTCLRLRCCFSRCLLARPHAALRPLPLKLTAAAAAHAVQGVYAELRPLNFSICRRWLLPRRELGSSAI